MAQRSWKRHLLTGVYNDRELQREEMMLEGTVIASVVYSALVGASTSLSSEFMAVVMNVMFVSYCVARVKLGEYFDKRC